MFFLVYTKSVKCLKSTDCHKKTIEPIYFTNCVPTLKYCYYNYNKVTTIVITADNYFLYLKYLFTRKLKC